MKKQREKTNSESRYKFRAFYLHYCPLSFRNFCLQKVHMTNTNHH